MKILDLASVPNHIETLAKWHHEEWGYLNPGQCLETRINKMNAYLAPTLLPSTWVALSGDELMGSAALLESDMDTHLEWSPWLASVYVHSHFREQGIGTALVKHVQNAAQAAGIKSLYLFTPNKEAFYARLGWVSLANENYRETPVTIMKLTHSS